MHPELKSTDKHKKKKRSFHQMNKKYARQGKCGKGSELPEDDYAYYIQLLGQFKNVEGEEKELLSNTLLGEIIKENTKKLISNQVVSRILDDALPHGEVSQVLSICQSIDDDLRTICLDPYSSHVMQTLLMLALKYSQECETEGKPVTSEQKEGFSSFLIKVGRYIFNNLKEFIEDTYGSYVFRSILEVFSGVQINTSVKTSQKSQTKHLFCHNASKILKIPHGMENLLEEIAGRLLQLPDLPDIICKECSSAALQSALIVLKALKKDVYITMVDHILCHGFPNITSIRNTNEISNSSEAVDLPIFFQSRPAARLFEVVLECASQEQLKSIFTQYFSNNMEDLVKHPLGNFSVQQLLLSWQDRDMFYELFGKVLECLPEALQANYTGIIYALVKSCRILQKHQGPCWKAIMELLKCYEPHDRQQEAAPCLIWFLNYDELQKKRSSGQLNSLSLSLHGSLILQEFLMYNKTMQIVDSIFAMNLSELQPMASDPRGSHVIDAFCASNFIKFIKKEQLINIFKGTYAALACSKHGSRSIEAMWDGASIKLKTTICEELSKEEFKLLGNQHGKIIFSKFGVKLFKKHDKQDWQEIVDNKAKKKNKLDTMLDNLSDEPKKKKKKETETDNCIDEPKEDKIEIEESCVSHEPKKKKKKKKAAAESDLCIDEPKEEKIEIESEPKKKKKNKREAESKEEKIKIEKPKKKKKKKETTTC